MGLARRGRRRPAEEGAEPAAAKPLRPRLPMLAAGRQEDQGLPARPVGLRPVPRARVTTRAGARGAAAAEPFPVAPQTEAAPAKGARGGGPGLPRQLPDRSRTATAVIGATGVVVEAAAPGPPSVERPGFRVAARIGARPKP